ncbi:MAG: hypothetical protein LBQ43_03500 [Holosporales bacterium]|nr:hypothetical protein [Holosporales bacterium]
MNDEALMIIAICNIIISSFLASVCHSKLVSVIWISLQLLILFVVFNAYYIGAFWGLFLTNGVILTLICNKKEEEKFQDIKLPEKKVTERKVVCALVWCGTLFSAISLVSWPNSFSSLFPKKVEFTNMSLRSEDNCLIFILAFLVLVSIVGCLKILKSYAEDV